MIQMKNSKSPHGYTVQELAEMFGVSLEDATEAVDAEMYYSAVAVDPDTGEDLIYPNDVYRISNALQRMGKLPDFDKDAIRHLEAIRDNLKAVIDDTFLVSRIGVKMRFGEWRTIFDGLEGAYKTLETVIDKKRKGIV